MLTVKLVAISGSPRAGGNSELLLNEVIRGAREAGAEVSKHVLARLDINPCIGCDACRDITPECIFPDDFADLSDELIAADIWVLATPLYWWGASAQLKAFIDRWYGMPYSKMAGKRAAVVITQGDNDLAESNALVSMLGSAFAWLKMQLHPPLIVSASKKGDVLKNQVALKQAFDLGKSLVN
ncbi:MAG: flavodoxin family protein [bacterium]|nr:flavodoxin family protein [bacterium]